MFQPQKVPTGTGLRARDPGAFGARAPLEPRPAAAAPDARRRPCSRDLLWSAPASPGGNPPPRSSVSPAGAPPLVIMQSAPRLAVVRDPRHHEPVSVESVEDV